MFCACGGEYKGSDKRFDKRQRTRSTKGLTLGPSDSSSDILKGPFRCPDDTSDMLYNNTGSTCTVTIHRKTEHLTGFLLLPKNFIL